MANKTRSVWEIRFRALKHFLQQCEDSIVIKAGDKALRKELSAAQANQLIQSKKIYSSCLVRARQLELDKAHDIWLDCDW